MSGWVNYKIKDVSEMFYGKMPEKAKIGTGDYLLFSGYRYIDSYPETNCKKGDVIVIARGVGGTGDVKIAKSDCYLTNLSIKISFDNTKVKNTYFYYKCLLRSLRYLDSGSAQSQITIDNLGNHNIQVPDLPSQTRIASILSAYDDLIETNEKRIKVLEEMAERLYHEWFVKFKFPGFERVRLIDSGTEYGKIPEGWEVVDFSEAVSVNPPTKLENKQKITHVPMVSLSNTLSIIDINKTIIKNGGAGVKFKNSDTLFARITPCLQNGKNGFVNFLGEDEIATGSTEFIVMRAKKLTPIYIYILSRDANFRKAAEMTMVGASGRQRVQQAFFQSHQVVVPSVDLLKIFENRAQEMFNEVRNLNKISQALSKTRDLLIPQLVTGKREIRN